MKTLIVVSSCMLFFCSAVMADTHYVDLDNTTPSDPYTNWATAANDIQSAVDESSPNDTVMVADGHYILTSAIVITNDTKTQSLNGPEVTIVDGNGSTVCFLLGTNDCVISGFTVTNGHNWLGFGASGVVCGYTEEGGGGILRSKGSWNPVVTNCIITGNSGGGMFSGTANNCIISGNIATHDIFLTFGGGLRRFIYG